MSEKLEAVLQQMAELTETVKEHKEDQATLDFEQVKYQAVDESGNQINPNPNYGGVIRYQPPMTLRLGIQLGF